MYNLSIILIKSWRIIMKGLKYETIDDLRSINRSQYRNMPSDCAYCGYRNRPSSSRDSCSSCCHTNYNTSKNNNK